ncbi:hypothetical protein GGF46_000870 [Coemansia sp. RSA 552]|nr:hypothetical protein GGF46_000870 [Coemansia sp. RSA 552]
MGGMFAALGSVGAKLTVGLSASGTVVGLAHQVFPHASTQALGAAVRAVLVAATGASNFFMWLFFTKALRYGESTPRVMMMQTISNFVVTAACGVYLFGDALSLQWWAGASLIAGGLAMLNAEKHADWAAETKKTR